jgi:hypothetical protein
MFIIADIQKMFYVEFVGMCMIYLHTKFHLPRSSASLVTTIKLKWPPYFMFYKKLHQQMLLIFQRSVTSIRVLVSHPPQGSHGSHVGIVDRKLESSKMG